MQPIVIDQAIELALDALLGDRLALLCGAGLSMAAPSNIPSAAQLAAKTKANYCAMHGASRPELPNELGEQAQFFFERDELATVFLRFLIDQDAFAGKPNGGHTAAADLLLVNGLRAAVTTNVDALIETAGQLLLGQISVAVDGVVAAGLGPMRPPLCKIHGDWTHDKDTTVWAAGQLEAEPVKSRIATMAGWLTNTLLDCDLVMVGFWSDWDYLNALLEKTLGKVHPSKVIAVNTAEWDAQFAAKAKGLCKIGERDEPKLYYLKESGDVFLAKLREAFSRCYVRRVLHSGAAIFSEMKGHAPDPQWLEPAALDTSELWQTRRDLQGCLPAEPASQKDPPDEPILGLSLLRLRAKGAMPQGSYWRLEDRTIRVLRAPNQVLHKVEAAHSGNTAPLVSADVVVCVGAEDAGLPSDIAREGTPGTIARGNSSQWLTYGEAMEAYDL